MDSNGSRSINLAYPHIYFLEASQIAKKKLSKIAVILFFLTMLASLLFSISPVHAQYYTAYAYGASGTFTITDVTQSTSATGSSGVSLVFLFGDSLTFQVTPAGGKAFSYWSDGYNLYYDNPASVAISYSDISMTAYFTSSGASTFYINATADVHSAITPTGLTSVTQGNTQNFNWSASAGYFISQVIVDNNLNVNINPPYSFTNVQSNHTISVLTEPVTSGSYQYTFIGPYFDDGTTSNNTIAAVAYWVNGATYPFTLTGPAASITVSANEPLTLVTWNCSTVLNQTRSITFTPTPISQTFHLFITNPNEPSFTYNFPITDFYGMINAYLKSQVSIGGALYTVEQVDTNNIGSPNFIMQQYQTYTLTFVCNQGTYSQQFTAGSTLTNTLPVLAGAFPTTNSTFPEADAARLNATIIGMIYVDPANSTDSVNFLITHVSGTLTVIDYNNTYTGTSQNNTWSNADSQTTYTVTITASISNVTSAYGSAPQWIITVPQTASANPWLGAFDWLGQYTPTMPYTPTGWTGANGTQLTSPMIAEIIGLGIILLFLGIGSYRSSGVTCIIASLMNGILIFLGWWGNGIVGGVSAIPSFALCLFVAITITLGEAKQTEREV